MRRLVPVFQKLGDLPGILKRFVVMSAQPLARIDGPVVVGIVGQKVPVVDRQRAFVCFKRFGSILCPL